MRDDYRNEGRRAGFRGPWSGRGWTNPRDEYAAWERNRQGRHDEPWWAHEQNPGQGFSNWRGDASDRDWLEENRTRGPDHDSRFGPGYGRGYWRDYEREAASYGPPGGYADSYGRLGYADSGYGEGALGPSFRGRERGPHAGRGPRGYRRSDERIREDVSDLLTADPDVDASEIDVHVANGIVTLDGLVEDRAAKRLAEDIAESVVGVQDVDNNLKVRHGLLAALTGEKATDRELTREPSREVGTAATARTTPSGSAHARRNPRTTI